MPSSHGAGTPEGDWAVRILKRRGIVPPAGRWEEGRAARCFQAGGETIRFAVETGQHVSGAPGLGECGRQERRGVVGTGPSC